MNIKRPLLGFHSTLLLRTLIPFQLYGHSSSHSQARFVRYGRRHILLAIAGFTRRRVVP
jgi:hypothetical protein